MARSTQPKKVVPLYSDDDSKPTDEMRQAMMLAEKGGGLEKQDPVVILLEEKAAQITGKEAGMFVITGTMGNLVSVMCHCTGRGEEVILGEESHIFLKEQGGIASVGGVHPRTVKEQSSGELDLNELRRMIREDNIHQPVTRLICLENTHNQMGGKVLSYEYMMEVSKIAKEHGLKLHVDGARIFNASTVLRTPVAKLLEMADSAVFSLCKGLGASDGSMVVGSQEFIQRAIRVRKALGGGKRQSGVLAAAGLVALEKMTLRLQEDHDNAKLFSLKLAELQAHGVVVDPDGVQSNLVIFEVRGKIRSRELIDRCLEAEERYGLTRVSLMNLENNTIRAAFHHNVSREDVEIAIQTIRSILEKAE